MQGRNSKRTVGSDGTGMKNISSVIIFGICFGGVAQLGALEVSTGFDAGGSLVAEHQVVDNVNGIPGMKGGGWLGEWTVFCNACSFRTAEVKQENPLHEGGNYLFYQFKTAHKNPYRQFYISRGVFRKGWEDGLDFREPYTVSFDLRPDNLSLLQTPEAFLLVADSYSAGNCEQDKAGLPQDGLMAWGIRAAAGKDTWEVYQGEKNNTFDSSRYQDTGVKVQIGTVYHFLVKVDPREKRWQVVIESDKQPAYESPVLSTACSSFIPRNARWMNFGGCLGSEFHADLALAFSLDSLVIKQVEAK